MSTVPPIIPPRAVVPIPERDEFAALPAALIEPLRGNFKRDWMLPHAYHCLPLVMGSQHGFIVKALYDFWATWDGTPGVGGVTIRKRDEDASLHHQQVISSHFGMGTVTIQNRWQFRTERGVSLMTMAPPNFFTDGLGHLVAVVETDNLRRDFTFNLKLTRSGLEVHVRKGDPIGCVMPIARGFFDQFQLGQAADMLTVEQIAAEREAAAAFAREREGRDTKRPNGNGNRYRDGEDAAGNEFLKHQRKLDAPGAPFQIEGAYPEFACAALVEAWEKHRALAGHETGETAVFDGRVIHLNEIAKVDDAAANLMLDIAARMVKEIELGYGFCSPCQPLYPDDVQLVKWREGDEMHPHADREHPNKGPHATPWRYFAATLYLNDGFAGGELYFPKHGIDVVPKAGNMVVFTGGLDSLHGVRRVKSGERYTCVAWFTTDPGKANALYLARHKKA